MIWFRLSGEEGEEICVGTVVITAGQRCWCRSLCRRDCFGESTFLLFFLSFTESMKEEAQALFRSQMKVILNCL